MNLRTVLAAVTFAMLAGCSGSVAQSEAHMAKAAQIRLQLGLEYMTQGDMPSARYNLERALKYAPNDDRTHLAMALYEQQMGNQETAQNYYLSALRISPHNGTILNNYGVFLCSSEQYEAAQIQFRAALGVADYEQSADINENSGYCFLREGRYNQVQELLGRALKSHPSKGRFLLEETERLIQQGKQDQVRLLLDVYQQAMPQDAESLWLNIRFAALEKRADNVEHYGKQLAQNFPHSQQYQQYLDNEY